MAAAQTNWTGNVTFGATCYRSPTSVAELQELVATSDKVRAVGSGHSFNELADTPGTQVCVTALPPSIELDPVGSTVTVAAGMRYGELAPKLDSAGFALEALGSLPHITVGGAAATGTHGSGNRVQGLAAAVVAIERVGADGERTVIRSGGDADFAGSVVALGALGIVTRLTLRVVPAFNVRQWVYDDLSTAVAQRDVKEIFASAYSVSMFTDWRSESFRQLWLKRRTDDTTHPDPLPQRWLGATLADGPRHPIAGMPVRNCTAQLGAVGPWHARLPHFRSEFTPSSGRELQSEYLLPREAAGDAIAALNAVRGSFSSLVQVSEIRTIGRDDLWLSPSYGRDTVAIHFTWVPDVAAVRSALAVIEDVLMPYEPRPHWGKVFTVPPETLATRYERYADFTSLARRRDPTGKFRNELLDRWLPAAALP